MLSAAQMSVLRYHADAGDRIAYYTALADFGVAYGQLALGVVLNNTLSGISANSFFWSQAGGASLNNIVLAEVSLALMQADFDRRDALNGADLTVDDIQTYHRDVFSDVAGAPANAWTPNMYLETFETFEERQTAWDSMLATNSVFTFYEIQARKEAMVNGYLEDNPQIVTPSSYILDEFVTLGDLLSFGIDSVFANWLVDYTQYLTDLAGAGMVSVFYARPNGPYEIGVAGAGNMIGGNGSDNTLIGTGGDDVMNGQGGDDTFIGGDGSDRIHGGSGDDMVDYSFDAAGIIIQLGALQGGTADEWAAINEASVVQRVQDGQGNWDFAIDVEQIVGTVYDDRARFFGAADDYFNADDVDTLLQGGGNTDLGDVLDFSALTDVSSGLTAIWDASGTINFNTGSWAAAGAAEDFEAVIGSTGNNTITGDDQANGINGHLGADVLVGGGGDDFIFFDAADGPNVDGGAGRDVAVALGSDGVTVDMTAQGLECVIGGDGADTITVGDGEGNLMVAGGAGADTIIVSYGDGQDTRILWGSDDSDADEFAFVNTGLPGAQLGLLVVTVAGLTTENFATFDLSMLNLPASFNWGAIDAVIINPDSQDNYYGLSDTTSIFTEYYGIQAIDETLSGTEWDVVWSGAMQQSVQGSSGVLGATLHMQVPEYGSFVDIWYREKGDTATAWLNGTEYYDQGIRDLIEDLTDEYGDPVVDWSIDMSEFDEGGDGTGVLWFREAEWNGGPDAGDQWFVAGGAIYDTQIVTNGAPHAIMPEDSGPSPFDWLLAA
jgi:hypothetical protein